MSGDTLFSLGCGRIFEGTYFSRKKPLNKLKKLFKNTKVYCGHEYTLANLTFALEVEHSNQALKDRYESCVNLRNNDQPTIPSLLELEIQTNPFLRSDQKIIRECIMQKFDSKTATDAEIFSYLREWKDSF